MVRRPHAAVADFLERFRPAGTAGAAAQGGVPADRIADTAAELGPVFMMLDGVEAEAGAHPSVRGRARRHNSDTTSVGKPQRWSPSQARSEATRAEAAAQSRGWQRPKTPAWQHSGTKTSRTAGTVAARMPLTPTTYWSRLERYWRSSANRRASRAMRLPPVEHRVGGRKRPGEGHAQAPDRAGRRS